MGKHFAGKKISSSHTSTTDFAARVVKLLIKMPEVNKVTLGVIKPNLRAGPQRIKMILITGGIRLAIRSSTSIQYIYAYTTDVEAVRKTLEKNLKMEITMDYPHS